MHFVTFALLFLIWAGHYFMRFNHLFLANVKRPFHTKSEMNKTQAEGNSSVV